MSNSTKVEPPPRGEGSEDFELSDDEHDEEKELEDDDCIRSSCCTSEDDVEDEEDLIEIDPPPRALVSAQMEYLIASAAVGESPSEFDQIGDAFGKRRVLSWCVKDRKLQGANIDVYALLFDDQYESRMEKASLLILDTQDWQAYHWIGKAGVRADEAVAAFKTVELAKVVLSSIGQRVHCRREVQGLESNDFRALAAELGPFDENDSKEDSHLGGQHEIIETSNSTAQKKCLIRMYSVIRRAAKRAARLIDVEPKAQTLRTLEAAQFVLIIDSSVSNTLFVWRGVLSSQKERAAGMEAALVLRRERTEIHSVAIVDQGEEPKTLWKCFPDGEKYFICFENSEQKIYPTNTLEKDTAPKMWRSETVVSRVCEKLLDELVEDAVESLGVVATPFDLHRPRGRPRLPEVPWYRRIFQGITTTLEGNDVDPTLKDSIPVSSTSDVTRRSHFVAAGQGAISWTRCSELSLYVVRWHRGELDAVEARLAEDSLKSYSCGVLNAGGAIYVWRGRSAGSACRSAATHVATELLNSKPEWCSIINVDQGSEPAQFRSQFNDWALSEISRAQALAAVSYNRHYQRREESSSSIKQAPSTWRETIRKNFPTSRKLQAQQQAVFTAVASMLRQSWGHGAGDRNGSNNESHASENGESKSMKIRQRRHSLRWRKREYLCGDPESDDEECEDDDHLEKRCRARTPLDDTVDHHMVAWRLENGRLIRVDEAEHGHFCADQSYAVLYGTTIENEDEDDIDSDSEESVCWEDQFDEDGAITTAAALRWKKKSLMSAQRRPDNRFVLVFWQGERTPREHRSRWLLEFRPWILEHWAEELRLGKPTEHLRVRQRCESRLFLDIATRAMDGYVVHAGGPPRHCHLFQVRGDQFAFAVEVAPYVSSLNSADVFIAAKRGDLEDAGDPARPWESRFTDPSDWTVWVWVGSGSNLRCRRSTAGLVLKIMEYLDIDDEATTVTVLDEAGDDGSDERLYFWRALGGPNSYADHPLLRVPPGRRSSVTRTPLFFLVITNYSNGRPHHLNYADGNASHDKSFGLECNLIQKGTVDQHQILHNDRAVVVDAHFQVMVWLGKNAKRRDAALAKRIAFAYAAATRSPPCRVRVVRQNHECSHFKCLFHGWDSGLHRLHNDKPKIFDLEDKEGATEASTTTNTYTDPRATYLNRKKTERNMLQQVETQENPAKKAPRRRASIVKNDSLFLNLLTNLMPGEKDKKANNKMNNKKSATNQHQQNDFAGIQLGRVIDTPEPDSDESDDDIFQDRLMPIQLDLEGHDGATMDIPADTTDPILLGAEASHRADRHRRLSCSF